ncbi:MAG: VOC family protein [Pseudomonadota bacterium]
MTTDFSHIFIATDNFDASVALYRDNLGFNQISGWGEEGQPRGAVLQLGSFQVIIGEEHDADDKSWSHGVRRGAPTVHLSSSDFQGIYQKAADAGCVEVPPEKTHWGAEWFVLRDPDGTLIAVNRTA